MKGFLLTMQYNERRMLPFFLQHYGQFFDASQIYVIDHGSDENLVPPGCNRIHVPRDKAFSEEARRNAVTFAAAMLRNYYDWGVFVDADEIIDLRAFDPAVLEQQQVLYMAGFNVVPAVHDGKRRVLGLFDSHFCKPAVFRNIPQWLMGFHGSISKPQAQLVLPMAHFKYFDAEQAVETQEARKHVYGGMKESEKKIGIDGHWGHGAGLVEAFHQRIARLLQAGAVPQRFTGVDADQVFELKGGGYSPVQRDFDTLYDLTEFFPYADLRL